MPKTNDRGVDGQGKLQSFYWNTYREFAVLGCAAEPDIIRLRDRLMD